MLALKRPDLLRAHSYFQGSWKAGCEGRFHEVLNPASSERVGLVPMLSSDEVSQSIEYAFQAMQKWQAKSATERGRVLRRWFDLLEQHRDDLARILTAEQGKPLAEARTEISYGASYVDWYSEEARRINGDIVPPPSHDRQVMVLKEPVGVCAAITPWNFPSAMIARKVAPALAAGCAILVKPALQTPLSALALAVLAEEAGVVPGAFSVITGDAREVGDEFCRNPLVRKLSFTGSTHVGKILIRQCADTVKKVTMELGGNAPFVVFDDADLDEAVKGCLASKFRNSGQTCVCANRIFAQEGIYGEFTRRLAEAVGALRVGNGFEEGVDQGPLIDEPALEKVEGIVRDAVEHGAEVLLGGDRHALGGTFYQPTVLAGCHPKMRLAQEEIFGPIAPVFQFSSEDEVVAMANSTPFGLASYFYSRDVGRIWRVASRLEYGMVGINTGMLANAMAPFGGVKESGMGREGGRYGIEDYLVTKYLCMAY
jgi:succinate-semialdehyde dehydrogenase/glutarate-semialdehyde dehydrogenase